MCWEYVIGVGVGAWKVLFTYTMFCCLPLLCACCLLPASRPPPGAEVASSRLGPASMSVLCFSRLLASPAPFFKGLFALACV